MQTSVQPSTSPATLAICYLRSIWFTEWPPIPGGIPDWPDELIGEWLDSSTRLREQVERERERNPSSPDEFLLHCALGWEAICRSIETFKPLMPGFIRRQGRGIPLSEELVNEAMQELYVRLLSDPFQHLSRMLEDRVFF